MPFQVAWKRHRMTNRRFPPPWSVEEQPACYVVRDRGGQTLAYFCFEEEPGRRSAATLRRGEALRERLEARFSGLCLPISKSVS